MTAIINIMFKAARQDRKSERNTMTHIDLTTGHVKKQLAKLSLPLVFGIMAIVSVSLVDAYFIGFLGDQELAAIGYTFPVVTLWDSFTIGLGVGVASLISQTIGSKKRQNLPSIVTTTLILSMIMGVVALIAGWLTLDLLFPALGASSELMPLIQDYMIPMFIGNALLYPGIMGNAIFRGMGQSNLSAIVLLTATVVNAVLDPILIFGWGIIPEYGIAGAGYATIIARISSVVVILFYLRYRYHLLTLPSNGLNGIKDFSQKILSTGLPAALANIIGPIGVSILTRLISSYGDLAIAGYGLAYRIEILCYVPFFALAGGLAPFTGQNWGANRKDRIRIAIRTAAQWSFLWGISIAIVLSIFGQMLGQLFTQDPEIIHTMALYLSIVPWGYFALGLIQITAAKLNATNHAHYAVLIPIMQFFVLIIPLAWLGHSFFGLTGLFYGIPIGLIISGLVAFSLAQKITR